MIIVACLVFAQSSSYVYSHCTIEEKKYKYRIIFTREYFPTFRNLDPLEITYFGLLIPKILKTFTDKLGLVVFY